MPWLMFLSFNSVRSRPAEKCSPSPATSTAPMSSGSDVKNCSTPMMVSSSSALRFCGRLSFSTATLPCRSAAREAGNFTVRPLDDIHWLTICVRRGDHVAMGQLAQRSVLDQRTAAFVQGAERLVGRDRLDDLE